VKRRRVTTPPPDLDDASKTFWRRTLGQLKQQGTWRDSDVPTLKRYVRACELARRARAQTPDHGTTRGAAGQFVEHPLIRTARDAERDAHRYAE
jgi:phage terminase small subunit